MRRSSVALSITICSQNPKGKMTEEIVLENFRFMVFWGFFFFSFGDSCILLLSEIQGEAIIPLGFPNEQDANSVLLSET